MGQAEIYSSEYYGRIADLETRHWWHIGMRRIAAALLRSQHGWRQGARVLDAGCGTGAGMMWARDLMGAGTVIGVDVSGEALRLAKLRAGLPLAQASVLRLPFRSKSFDLVVCQDVLQHLPTDGADVHSLAEMYRVLRPGGHLLVRANSRLGMWQEATKRDADFQRYILAELVSRVRAAGFVGERATYANALPAVYASFQRWVRLRARRDGRGRLYEGLGVQDTASRHPRLNRLLLYILKAEALYLRVPRRCLVFGHSTFCLAMRPVDGATARFG